MNKKQTTIIITFAVVVLGGIVIGLLVKKNGNPILMGGENNGGVPGVTSTLKNAAGQPAFTTEVPKNAVETIPTQVIPIVNQPNAAPGAKFASFQILATKNGYSPSSITVKKGDTVEINLVAQDGSYDIFSGNAGFYASASPSKPGKISFGVGTSGTFSFGCRDLCPTGKTISGQLIVMP